MSSYYFTFFINIPLILVAMTPSLQENLLKIEQEFSADNRRFALHLQSFTDHLQQKSFNKKTWTNLYSCLNTLRERFEKTNQSCCSICQEGELMPLERLQDDLQKKKNNAYSFKFFGGYFLIASGVMLIDKIAKIGWGIPFTVHDIDIIFVGGSGLSCLGAGALLQKKCSNKKFIMDNYTSLFEKHTIITANYKIFKDWHEAFKNALVKWSSENYHRQFPLAHLVNGQEYDEQVLFSLPKSSLAQLKSVKGIKEVQ